MNKERPPIGTILHIIGGLEHTLELAPGFHDRLLDEDDWSFIIKVSALIENACSYALVTRFDYPHEHKQVFFVDIPQHLRIKMLHNLGLLEDRHKKVLMKLSTLRNAFAHKPTYSNHDLDRYFEDNTGELHSWVSCAFEDGTKGIHHKKEKYTPHNFFKKHPKLAIWQTTLDVLVSINVDTREIIKQRSK